MGAPFTGVSYFSGGGLADFGLSDVVEHVCAVEYDPAIAAHYATVFPGTDLRVSDVCAVDPSRWAGVTYFHASPSCRNASVANADRGETPEDRAAGEAVCRGIRVMRPKVFTLENVGAYQAFDAFRAVCACLTECGYLWDARVYNSADFGVPQTRKRLYIRAWLRPDPLPYLAPTYASREKLAGAASVWDMFSDAPILPWVGWLEALTHPRYGDDLIPSLPASQFAPWQWKRLKQEMRDWVTGEHETIAETFLIDNLATCREATLRLASDPMFAITIANSGRRPANMPSAFLCGVQGEGGDLAREQDTECPALTATHGAGKYRAFIVDAQETVPGPNGERIASVPNACDPSLTVTATAYKGMPRAFIDGVLVEGDAAGDRCPTRSVGQEPSFTLKTSSGGRVHRAVSIETGRIVSLTAEALARFQMGRYAQHYPLPTNRTLACKILGNGCATESHRAIVLPLLEAFL